MEGIDYVICPLCNKKLLHINWSHVWAAHKIKWEKFKILYPNIQIHSEKYWRTQKEGIRKSVEKLREEGRYEPDSPWVLNLSYHATKQWEEGLHEREWNDKRKQKLSNAKIQQWADGTYNCMVGENHYN